MQRPTNSPRPQVVLFRSNENAPAWRGVQADNCPDSFFGYPPAMAGTARKRTRGGRRSVL